MTRRALLLVLVLGFVASGCSLGPRETWAESMRRADRKGARTGVAKVHVTAALRVIETTIRVTPQALFSEMDGVVDFKHHRSELVARQPASRKGSRVVFDDLVMYLPRSDVSRGTSPQHWARYDFKKKPDPKIDANDRRLALGVLMSPATAGEILSGVLAGSIKRKDTTQEGGLAVTHYDAKLAPDAAVRELRSEERHDGILRVFSTLGELREVFPVRVWMDDQGYARRIELVLRQQKDRVNAFKLTLNYEFSDYGTNGRINVPQRSDTVTNKRFEDFVVEYIRVAT
jgi:hypothetical protein